MIGPGQYDALATLVREHSRAEGVVVMILEGNQGSGFSVRATPRLAKELPDILRAVAGSIEADIQTTKGAPG